jgi:hypothetical protein
VLKRILVVAGGLTLAVSLPIVALGVTTERTPALDNSAVEVSEEVPQPLWQQRLRVHAETGPPEGFVPVRQRLHQPDAVDSGDQNMVRRQQVDAPSRGCTGECPNDGEPSGAANRGPGGVGAYGQGGRGNG